MASKLNKLYKVIIFLQYMLLSILLCVLAFPIVYNDDILKTIPHIFHAVAGIVEMLIYSYCGQTIMDLAADICKNCYESDMMMVMLRTKYEVRIESMFYHASLPTFTLMVSWTMSLITLMKSFL
ncbi:hypothetical protein ACKWTF_014375 [Chironomus riparius]